ncbi:tetratricopeptide repeat protein [Dysgonomonas reticulitermitis]
MPQFKIVCVFLFTVFLVSCNFHGGADKVLTNVEALVDQYPDSALRLLDTEILEKNLDRDAYYKYILLYTQARDRKNMDIKNDTLIFQVRDYYLNKKDLLKIAKSYYYSGRVLESQNKKEDALSMYLDAELYALQTENDRLKGDIEYSIGAINHKKYLKDEAISRFKLSAQYYHKSANYKNEFQAHNGIGTAFLFKKELDSSFFYLDKSLLLAQSIKDSAGQGFALQNIGIAYRMTKDYQSARAKFKQAIPLFKKNEDKARIYLNIAYSFNDERNRDSTLYNINNSLELIKGDETSSLRSMIIQLQSRIEENDKNYEKALAFQKEYADYLQKIFKEANNQAVLDIQKKYDFEVIQNENNRLLIEKQSASLIRLGLIVLVLGMSIFIYWKNVKNKEALTDAELKISQLNDMAESFNKKENSFKKVLLEHFDILKKVALLEGHMRDDEKKQGQKLLKKVNEIIYKQESLDWNMLNDTMNQLYNGFPEKLQEKFPQLEDAEVRICCLVYAGLNNNEISILMEWTINTIQMKKSIIRKKIGVEGYGNLSDFLIKLETV